MISITPKEIVKQDYARVVGWKRFLFWKSPIFYIPEEEKYLRVDKLDKWGPEWHMVSTNRQPKDKM